MMVQVCAAEEVHTRVLEHLLRQFEKTPAIDEPFSHFYLEQVFPEDLYEQLLSHMPEADSYYSCRNYRDGENGCVRASFELSRTTLRAMPAEQQALWRGVASVLSAPQLKAAVYRKLAKDLAFRFGVDKSRVAQIPGFTKPTLYRETEGFEIAPHTDTRKKVVTMQLYLPADNSQLDLGTALYQRRLLAWPFGSWRHRFAKCKQFAFRPNSGYAFVVNNTYTRKSWHGREKLPADAGVRQSLNATFYQSAWEDFGE